MNCDYKDIRSRIQEPPYWFDENACPRYCAFRPKEAANIYAREVAFVQIACQACRRKFFVAFSVGLMDEVQGRATLRSRIESRSLGYGDPPNVECCAAGPTMTSDTVRVLEYWRHDETTDHEWRRDAEFEVGFDAAD